MVRKNQVGAMAPWITPRKPENLLPTAVAKNQPPMVRPTKRLGLSLVTSDSAIGDRHSSPQVTMQ